MSETKYRCKECSNDDQELFVWAYTVYVSNGEMPNIFWDDFKSGSFTEHPTCSECGSDDIGEVQG